VPVVPSWWFTGDVNGIEFGLDQIRTLLHLVGVSVWFGGQILMLGLLPVLRKLGGDAPRQAAAGFAGLRGQLLGSRS